MTSVAFNNPGKAILATVRANHARLDACKGPHDFQLQGRDAERPAFRRYVCSHCRGDVDGMAATWYRRGLEHGK